jgi:hypothetical protein
LPAAFGEFRDAPYLQDRICRECNRRLGLLDEQLTRGGPEAFLRRHYGITGRPSKREKVNPFERRSAGAERLQMKSFDKNLGMDVLLEVDNGVARQMCQMIFVKDGQPHHLPIRRDTTADQLRATYDELGIAQPEQVHVVYGPEEATRVEALVKEAWPSTALSEVGVAATTYDGAVVEVRLTDRYLRDVAKIGFHYFLTQFPEYTGHEEMFADIKKFIVSDRQPVDGANAVVGKRERPLLGEMLPPGTRPKGWVGHVVCAEIKDGVCLAHVQLFVSGDYPAPAYTVHLASGAGIADRGSGHLYTYLPDGPQGKFVGEACDLRGEKSHLQPLPLRPVVVPE